MYAGDPVGLPPFTMPEDTDANVRFGDTRAPKRTLDVSLVIDTTGSMGDEIRRGSTASRHPIRSSVPAAIRWMGPARSTRARRFGSSELTRSQVSRAPVGSRRLVRPQSVSTVSPRAPLLAAIT